MEGSSRHADLRCMFFEPVLPCSKAEHRHFSSPEALSPCRVTLRHHKADTRIQEAGRLAVQLWIPISGLPILDHFDNSSHTRSFLGRTLLPEEQNSETARSASAISPHFYPMTPNSNGSTFECRRQRLAPLVLRVSCDCYTTAFLSS